MSRKNQQDEFPSTWSNADLQEMVQAGEVAKQELERRQAYAQGERSWHLISGRELDQREADALARGVQFGSQVTSAADTVYHAHVMLWQTLTNIAGVCYECALLPATQRAITLRARLAGHGDIQPSHEYLLTLAGQLDRAVKDYGPFLDSAAPGNVDHIGIKKHLAMAGAVRDGILALLREINPDDGTLLQQAIAEHSPLSHAANQQMVDRLRGLNPKLGPPTQRVTSEAMRLVQSAMEEFHIKKGERGYRANAKSKALSLLFRERNAKDRDELGKPEQEVHDYLADIDDSMISKWVG